MSLLSALTNVPLGTANVLAYSMLAVVGIFLVSGPIIVYIYYKKNKKTKVEGPTQAPA